MKAVQPSPQLQAKIIETANAIAAEMGQGSKFMLLGRDGMGCLFGIGENELMGQHRDFLPQPIRAMLMAGRRMLTGKV